MATLTRPQTAPRLVTWDDYLKLDDDDGRELLDGRLNEPVRAEARTHGYAPAGRV